MPGPTPSFGTAMSSVRAEPPNARKSNGSTMARSGRSRRTIADAAHLQDIMERQLVGDSLGIDAQGARRDHVDHAVAEPGRAAAVVDDRGGRTIAEDLARATPVPMLELDERR